MSDQHDLSQTIEELTLLLLYLGSWEEELPPGLPALRRSWKGFRFAALDALEGKGYLHQTRGAKSVTLTPEGLQAAVEIGRRHGIVSPSHRGGLALKHAHAGHVVQPSWTGSPRRMGSSLSALHVSRQDLTPVAHAAEA